MSQFKTKAELLRSLPNTASLTDAKKEGAKHGLTVTYQDYYYARKGAKKLNSITNNTKTKDQVKDHELAIRNLIVRIGTDKVQSILNEITSAL